MDLLRRTLLAALALCASGCIAPDTLTTRLIPDAAVASDAAVLDAPCPLRQVRCGGVCVSVDSDAMNCGACGVLCARPHANALCAAGTCRTLSCEPGYGDCNGVASDGCEVFVAGADVTNCGRCSSVCTAAPTGASPVCRAGVCGISAVVCPAGAGNCDGADANGCETDVTTSVMHCGACGRPCSLAHATARCVGGACAVGGCDFGFLDCDGVAANGCEVSATTDTSNCGVCGRVCPTPAGAMAACASGVCTTRIVGCPPGTADCNGSAADGCEASDVNTNPSRCGPTCAVCNGAHGTATCSAGACGVTCSTGFANCNAMSSDGCETSVFSNNANCGGCGVACTGGKVCSSTGTCVCPTGQIDCSGTCRASQTDNANCGTCGNTCVGGSACSAGVCTCASGLTLCGTGASAVCRDRSSDVNNCGTCGNVCTGGRVCTSGSCVCPTGQANCSGTCRNLQTDTANCGVCGRSCLPGQVCSAGMCGTVCSGGLTNCNDMCIDVTTNTAHCGGCGMACSTTNVTAGCVGSACTGTCAAGFGDCDSNRRANGCETNVQTSTSHCGACGVVCSTQNIARACSGGLCNGVCNAGYGDCNGNKQTDGCETNLRTSPAHCGFCGNACAAGNVCAAGACVACGAAGQPTCATGCNAGITSCGGTCRDLTSDDANCNACGNGCSGRTACASGACAACGAEAQPACRASSPACDAPLVNCAGTCQTAC